MMRQLMPHVWPKQGPEARSSRMRIGLAMGLLFAGKVLNVQVPFLFKELVETVNETVLGSGLAGSDLNVLSVSGSVLLACIAVSVVIH